MSRFGLYEITVEMSSFFSHIVCVSSDCNFSSWSLGMSMTLGIGISKIKDALLCTYTINIFIVMMLCVLLIL